MVSFKSLPYYTEIIIGLDLDVYRCICAHLAAVIDTQEAMQLM